MLYEYNSVRMAPSSDIKLSFGWTALSAGTAACMAEAITIPLDAAKVRMQLNSVSSGSGEKVPNVISTLSNMNEGIRTPYVGLVAGFQRQLVFGTLRISMYDPIRDYYTSLSSDPQNAGLGVRIIAGMTSGALAMLIASPTDLVKVRLQGDARRPKGTAPRYPPGIAQVYKQIIRTEGFAALWTGVGPNIARNMVINSAEMAAYDQFKTVAKSYGAQDGLPLHFSAGLFAGLMAVVFGSPVDVIKTRMMNAKAGEYNGVFDVVKSTAREGVFAFYKGFWANFARIGSFNTLVFVFYEQLKKLAASRSH